MVAPPSDAENVYAKWLDWLDRLKSDVLELHHHREIWRVMNDALGARPGSETFHDHYARCYVAAAASAVRRLADPRWDDDSITVARLLNDVGAQRHVMTRARYVQLFDGSILEEIRKGALAEFDRLWGDAHGLVRPSILTDHGSALNEASKHIASWVDRTIAHLDKRGPASNPTFSELDDAILTLGQVLKSCLLLLRAESWMSLTPTPQDDWQAPFRRPLFVD